MLSALCPCNAKESATVRLCYTLIRCRHIQTQFDLGLQGKRFFYNEANSQTAIDNAHQTDSESCKFVGFGTGTVTVKMQVGYHNQGCGSGNGSWKRKREKSTASAST